MCADKMGFIMQNFIFKGIMFLGLGVVSYSCALSFEH